MLCYTVCAVHVMLCYIVCVVHVMLCYTVCVQFMWCYVAQCVQFMWCYVTQCVQFMWCYVTVCAPNCASCTTSGGGRCDADMCSTGYSYSTTTQTCTCEFLVFDLNRKLTNWLYSADLTNKQIAWFIVARGGLPLYLFEEMVGVVG